MRSSVQGVREALPYLLNEGVRLGRMVKIGVKEPGQLWLVEVYKVGANSPNKTNKDEWVLDNESGAPGALIVNHVDDQLTWTGEVFDSFEEALYQRSGGQMAAEGE